MGQFVNQPFELLRNELPVLLQEAEIFSGPYLVRITESLMPDLATQNQPNHGYILELLEWSLCSWGLSVKATINLVEINFRAVQFPQQPK